MEEDFRIFVPFDLNKANTDPNMVFGFATTEEVDSDGEIITKEAIQAAWPAYAKFGNIREMHQAKAAGKLKSTIWKDGSPFIGVKVVDKEALEKVHEEVYMGFSIGGKKLKKVGNKVTKLKLSEISLVDRPSNPGAVFDVFKADKNGAENELMEKVIDSEIQKLLFPKANFTGVEAAAWAKAHNFDSDKIESEGNFHSIPQFDVDLCVKGTFDTWELADGQGIQATSGNLKKTEGDRMKIELVDAGPVLKKFVDMISKIPEHAKSEALKKNFSTVTDLIGILRTMIFLTKEVKVEEGLPGYPGAGSTEAFMAGVAHIADLALEYSAAQITASMELLGGVEEDSMLLSAEEVKTAMAGADDLEKKGAKFSKESVKILQDVMARITTLVAQPKEEKTNMALTAAEKKAVKVFRTLSDEDKKKFEKEHGADVKTIKANGKIMDEEAKKAEEAEDLRKAEELKKVEKIAGEEDLEKRVKAIEESISSEQGKTAEALQKVDEVSLERDDAIEKADGLKEDLTKAQGDLKKVEEDLKKSEDSNTALKKQVAKPKTGPAATLSKNADSGDKEIDDLYKMQVMAQTKGDSKTILKMTMNGTWRKDLEGKKYGAEDVKKFESEGSI